MNTTGSAALTLAASLQAQLTIAEQALVSISRCATPNSNDAEHALEEVIGHAQAAVDKLKKHRKS